MIITIERTWIQLLVGPLLFLNCFSAPKITSFNHHIFYNVEHVDKKDDLGIEPNITRYSKHSKDSISNHLSENREEPVPLIFSNLNEIDFSNYNFNDSSNSCEWIIFRNNHTFKGLFIVFAGPYPSSPSSAFGHLFLLLQSEHKIKKPVLLWDAINFAADSRTLNTLELYYNGIFGGLVGKYRITPFHEKIREYSFIESRPLWIFPVEINSKQSERFLKYLYILRDIRFKYRFHDKNCASQIESLLCKVLTNTGKPSRIITSPRDVLLKSDSLKTKILDPLYFESTEEFLEKLSVEDFKIANSLENSENLNFEYSNQSAASIILNILEWRYFKRNTLLDRDEKKQLDNLRLAVLKNKHNTLFEDNIYPKKFAMHPPSKIGYGIKLSDFSNFEHEFLFRFGMHEFHDNSDAYPTYDYISAGKLNIGYSQNNLQLNELWLFQQKSIKPNTLLSSYTSWQLAFGVGRKFELKNKPLEIGLFFGIGKTFSVSENISDLSIMLNVNPVYEYDFGYALKFGPELITTLKITNYAKIMTMVGTEINTFGKSRQNYFLKADMSIHFIYNYPILFHYLNARSGNYFGLQIERYIEW